MEKTKIEIFVKLETLAFYIPPICPLTFLNDRKQKHKKLKLILNTTSL